MDEREDELREAMISFALAVSDACIGANLFEGRYAQSRADFISKLEIALKECSETEYWLELPHRKEKLTDEQYKTLNNMRGTMQRKLIASITTAKKNGEK